MSAYSGHCQKGHICFLSLPGCALCICSYYGFEKMPDCQHRFQDQIKNLENEDPLSFHKSVEHSDCVLLANLSYHHFHSFPKQILRYLLFQRVLRESPRSFLKSFNFSCSVNLQFIDYSPFYFINIL